MANYLELRREAREYDALCDRAERVGVPTSLDDPRSPRTVEGLRAAVEAAEAEQRERGEWGGEQDGHSKP